MHQQDKKTTTKIKYKTNIQPTSMLDGTGTAASNHEDWRLPTQLFFFGGVLMLKFLITFQNDKTLRAQCN